MLTETSEVGVGAATTATLPSGRDVGNTVPGVERRSLPTVFRVEWIGQMAASLCWIASVLAIGISSAGDWLQLAAASAWLVANVAAAIDGGGE